jgi:hypothetical protein
MGFSTAAAMPLWELGTLTGKNWLCDDILNCQGEIMYFRHLAVHPLRQVQVLALTTHFYEEAERLYHQVPQLYSPNLIDIRSRLHVSNFREFTFKICRGDHWAAYGYDRSIVLRHRDSQDQPPSPKVLDVLDWVLDGLNLPFPTEIRSVAGLRQPIGSGSCGLAAQNFVDCRMDPGRPQWAPACAQQERDEWLRDLILFHLCTVGKGVRTISLHREVLRLKLYKFRSLPSGHDRRLGLLGLHTTHQTLPYLTWPCYMQTTTWSTSKCVYALVHTSSSYLSIFVALPSHF